MNIKELKESIEDLPDELTVCILTYEEQLIGELDRVETDALYENGDEEGNLFLIAYGGT